MTFWKGCQTSFHFSFSCFFTNVDLTESILTRKRRSCSIVHLHHQKEYEICQCLREEVDLHRREQPSLYRPSVSFPKASVGQDLIRCRKWWWENETRCLLKPSCHPVDCPLDGFSAWRRKRNSECCSDRALKEQDLNLHVRSFLFPWEEMIFFVKHAFACLLR